MDRSKMESGIRTFLDGLGERFEGDDLELTPSRVARAWCDDLVCGYAVDPVAAVTWTDVEPGGGPVVVRDVRFASICVHHLLPFFGTAQIGYAPDRRQAGLSKIGRVLDAHARRLQTQERLTAAVVDSLTHALQPRGVIAVLRAEHTCMTCRGVRKEQSRMLTMAASGIYRDQAELRREMLGLLGVAQDEGRRGA